VANLHFHKKTHLIANLETILISELLKRTKDYYSALFIAIQRVKEL